MATTAASIIVTCKGRRHHLGCSLPNMLAQRAPFPHEVVVVDYGCPQRTFEWCASLDCARLVAVRVKDGTAEFNRSRAHNFGAAAATGRALAFVDADMLLTEGWLAAAAKPVLDGMAGLSRVAYETRGWDRYGTCVVSAALFHQVRGYEEAFQGWGAEDIDFYGRCSRLTREVKFAASLLFPIRHGHEERVQFHAEKSIRESERRNKEYQRRRTQVNPQGYAEGEFEVVRGASDVLPAVEWPRPRRRFGRGIRYPVVEAGA